MSLTLIALGVAGFFAYKCFYLKKQSSEALPTPTSKITASPSPLSFPQPEVESKTNWKTFTYPTKLYSFKYPPNWDLSPDDPDWVPNPNYRSEVSVKDPEWKEQGSYVNRFYIIERGPDSNDEFLHFIEANKSNPYFSAYFSEYRTVQFNDKTAILVIFPGDQQPTPELYTFIELFVIHDNKGYSLSYFTPPEVTNLDQVSNLRPDIFSTFRFLD